MPNEQQERPSSAMLAATGPSHGEVIPDGEAAAIADICAAIEENVRRQAGADQFARRDAHAKAHATVQAEFRVLPNLPDELRQGVFALPRAFPALIRFSNGSGGINADWVPDGRGMAIKLLDVAESPSGTQDFLLIDYPVFFVRNASDYGQFSTGQASFFASLMHPHLHEAGIAGAIAVQRPSNPLAVRYWSMTPYAFGPRACKFSARPLGIPKTFDCLTHDFMRINMVRHLAEDGAEFDFMVQLRTADAQPIEDPTIEWPEADAPFVVAARITIPAQDFDTLDQRALGEALSFTPWHAREEHRPLGGINRVRRTVYESISTYRHNFNGAKRLEPGALPPLVPPAPQQKDCTMPHWFEREFLACVGGVVQSSGWLTDTANAAVINAAVGQTRPRPHPWSTYRPTIGSPFIDYPCWDGLTDRSYLAQHLRPVPPPADLPPVEDVAKLFERPDGMQRLSTKSTCLFPAFAQYLTDGFIRTQPDDTRRTTSNHEIDLCPLYGRKRDQTNALRLKGQMPGKRGRLKSRLVTVDGKDEEFSPALYDPSGQLTDPEFAALDTPLFHQQQQVGTPAVPAPRADGLGRPFTPERLTSLFAVGGDRVNASPFAAMINTLLLREHNRVAKDIETANPSWDDEHVFQVTRNIIIAVFIKIVVEEYINHITPLPFNLKADPSVAWNAKWNRPNWMTEEFSLLYRWHSLMPDAVAWPNWPGGKIPLPEFTLDNRPLLLVGLDAALIAASGQAAAELGAFNTEKPFLLYIEQASIKQGRDNHLPSYVDYCAAFRHKTINSFADISSNPQVQQLLQQLYGTVDRVEFYPGLFAEDRVPYSPLPGLLMSMVAVDAFSQALPNPLLSEPIWGDPATRDLAFTQAGFNLIANTCSLADILRRQGSPADQVTMTKPGWNYVDGPP